LRERISAARARVDGEKRYGDQVPDGHASAQATQPDQPVPSGVTSESDAIVEAAATRYIPAPLVVKAPDDADARHPERLELSLAQLMHIVKRQLQPVEEFHEAKPAPLLPQDRSHALPPAPDGFGKARWVTPSETVQVAGLSLPGGMIYVGSRMAAANGITEPALINPLLNVARSGDFRESSTRYWPSYDDISPTARRAYLSWLAEGRCHPDCDVGYVFLFFYGLERRVITDSRNDPAMKSEWPTIAGELRRLLAIYGRKFESFRRYAHNLLEWIELEAGPSRLYMRPIPDLPKSYELPGYLRLALGQASADRTPLPPALALAWVRLSPEYHLRTAATRCPREFQQLFLQRYQESFGPGLILPKNRTRLKLVYQAASAGIRGDAATIAFGDIPDVTALTAPIRTLGEIATRCTDELGSYSRLVGKTPSAAESFDGLLLLPGSLWPPEAMAKLEALKSRMRDGQLLLTLQDVFEMLGGAGLPSSRDRVRSLARALEGGGIGFEPHVLAGARPPAENDVVVLFAQPPTDVPVGSGAEYQAAALTLQLAAAMAHADGDFNDREVAHLRTEIQTWSHLAISERCRLCAHLHWLTAAPPTLASLKKKLDPLPIEAKETLAAFMATLAQSDGFVSPDEVRFLEKIYKALGVESKRVFNDVHAAVAGSIASHHTPRRGFHLDADRIAALQEDTARVSALLSEIFADEATNPETPPPTVAESDPDDEPASPFGLDEAHSALLRLLLSRPEWTRAELEDAASDLDLLLDGAIEQINEASFDAFDTPLCEGDDPVMVDTDLLKRMEA
jgi:hypothetical protein